MLHIKLMVIVCELLTHNNTVTKREVYYQHEAIFRSQADLDQALDRLARTFGVPRDDLGIVAGSKGLILGPCIQLVGAESPPSNKCTIPESPSVKSIGECPFVLVVEKEAVFQTIFDDYTFLQEQFGPFALITGKGFPCMATRKLVSQLGRLGLQVFCLVDFDPYGLEIARQYRLGSEKLPAETQHLACPSIVYAGLTFQDIDRYGDQARIAEKLTGTERKRLGRLQKQVAEEGWIELSRSIAKMIDHDVKGETEVIPNTHNYFTRTFLVDKLANLLKSS